ncbi:MAG: PH domain-containing protein [Planctomycetaceae bacterium]
MPIEVKSQPIPGVRSSGEALLESQSASIAASPIGRAIGGLCELIPIKIGGIKLSYLLFGPVVIPFALAGWAINLVTGNKYVLTNRHVQIRRLWGGAMSRQLPLAEIADVVIHVQPGQEFYYAGDLHLVNAKGESLLSLPGVVRPDRLRHAILEARDSRLQNDAALKVIQARK